MCGHQCHIIYSRTNEDNVLQHNLIAVFVTDIQLREI